MIKLKLHQDKIEKISHTVIQVLYSRFLSFPEDSVSNRNAPFHEAFLNAFSDKLEKKVIDIPFLISLNSWVHGLNTSIGQTFFEKTAQILSDGEKREYTSKKSGNLQITSMQENNINRIMTDLSNSINVPNLSQENEILFKNDSTDKVNAIDFSADVFIEDENQIIAIELKSVKPNSGEMRGEKQKILEGKTAMFEAFPNKNIKFFIGFPFDPTNETSTGKNKDRFLNSIINGNKFFAKDEVLLADELWDFLSGTDNTMEELLKIINQIAKPNFLKRYNYIDDTSNKHTSLYRKYLKEWNLFSELMLLENDKEIKDKIKENSRLIRVYNHRIFKKGKYNLDRYNRLKELL